MSSPTPTTPPVPTPPNTTPPAGGDGGTNDGNGWTAPTREEHDALLARLTKVNGEAAKWRLRAKAAAGEGDGTGNGTPTPSAAPAASGSATDSKTAKALEHLKTTAVNAQVRAELASAGFQNPSKDRIARALRMIDRSAIELDDDGEIDGLTEQIETLKADFPEFFTPADGDGGSGGKPRAGRVTTAGRAGGPNTGAPGDDDFARTKSSASRWAQIVNGA
jgi:hypothetical protein